MEDDDAESLMTDISSDVLEENESELQFTPKIDNTDKLNKEVVTSTRTGKQEAEKEQQSLLTKQRNDEISELCQKETGDFILGPFVKKICQVLDSSTFDNLTAKNIH